MAKAGRKPFTPTDKILSDIEGFAAQGLNKRQIITLLGISEETFYKAARSFPELTEAFDRGKTKGIATIVNVVFNKAKEGQFQFVNKYLNSVCPEDWGDKVDNVSSDGSMTPSRVVQVVVTPDEYDAINSEE